MLERVLKPLPGAAVPLDLFRHDGPPTRWRARTGEGWLMGYFNWDDMPRVLEVDPGDWGRSDATLQDFWTGEELGADDSRLALPPHHSRLIRVVCS